MTQTDVAIIGAGPYGLSISAHLRARGIDHVVLGRPLESWRAFMPEKMVLKSEPFACNLWDAGGDYTLETYRVHRGLAYQPCGAPLPLRDFLSYADWFQRNAAPDVLQTYAHALRREASGGFSLDLDQGGTLRARSVVLASGHMPFRETPEALRHLPPELCIHSSDASDIQRFAGKDVTIVGLGQAALEHSALLHEAGARVRVIGRDARDTWNGLPRPAPTLRERIAAPEGGLGAGWRAYLFSEFPRLFRQLPDETRLRVVRNGWGPAGSWWLRGRVEGKVPISTGSQIEQAKENGGRVLLKLREPGGVSEIFTDHVIAATGFRVDFDRLAYVDPALRASVTRVGGSPVLSDGFETSVPGLHAVGAMSAATFGPVMRFMYGAKHAAPLVARRLASRSRGAIGQSWSARTTPGLIDGARQTG
jgi:thioredoxin reductase